MNNTISVGGMTSYYNSFIQSTVSKKTASQKENSVDGVGGISARKTVFAKTVEKQIATSSVSDVSDICKAEAVSTKDMSLDEYKQYIQDKISDIPIHSSKMCDSRSISISEAGFKAMQADPEYEKWVLDKISETISTGFPSSSRALTGRICGVTSFGASKEDFRSMSWSEGYQNGTGDEIWAERSKGSFWSHRGNRKEMQVQADKKAAAKRELEKKWQKEAIEKRQAYTDFLNGKAMLETNNPSDFSDMFAPPVDARVSGILSSYEMGTLVGNFM